MAEYNTEQFEKDCKALGVTLSDEQIRQFLKYFEMLVEWNEVMNLTAITEYDEVVMKHFVDSLSIVKVNGFDNVPEKTIDVLRKNKFTDYLETKSTKFIYYNVLDTYIVLKK